MDRSKIRIDLSNYFYVERGADFKLHEEKVYDSISSLYNSKTNIPSMAGWLNSPHDSEMFSKVNNFVSKITSEGKYKHLLVLGIGGSSLGAQALIEGIKTPLWSRLSKGKRKDFLAVDFIDNLDPQIIRAVLNRLKLDETLFVVISKSGSTVETIVPMLIAKEWVGENFYKQCVFITTKGKGLLSELAQKFNVPLFEIPENVGGRYSVFSPVGLIPAGLCGIDLNEVRAGLLEADRICQLKDMKENLAASIALSSYFSYLGGKNVFVLMPYSTCLKRFVDWFVQLWAESLGKAKKGSTPIPAIGATDQHSQIQLFNEGPNDKLICFVKINKHKKDLTIPDYSSDHPDFKVYAGNKTGKILNLELDATRRALMENQRPSFMITLPELDEYYLSQFMYILEVATAISGNLLGVNPFDQPGVELAKKYTKEALLR